MPGRPKTRAKREVETQRAGARAKRYTSVDRERILKRSVVVGAVVAAREAGVRPATLRTWRHRAAAEPEASVPVAEGVAEAVVEGETVGGLEGMRRAYEAARKVEAAAVAQTETLLGAGQAKDAQAASVAGGVWSDKALALGKAIAAAEGEEEAQAARLAGDRLALQAGVLRAVFDAIDVPVPVGLLRELARRAAEGLPLGGVPEELVSAARELVTGAIRGQLRGEIEAGLRAEQVGEQEEGQGQEEAPAEAMGEDGDGEFLKPGSWRDEEPSAEAVTEEPKRQGYVPGGNRTSGWKRNGLPREGRGGRLGGLRHPMVDW